MIGKPVEIQALWYNALCVRQDFAQKFDETERAHLKVYGDRERAAQRLTGFRAPLLEAWLGQIAKIFDAEPPHTPCGCIAQAWSVAELLCVTHTHPLSLSDSFPAPKTPMGIA